jgi:hypothetical protein
MACCRAADTALSSVGSGTAGPSSARHISNAATVPGCNAKNHISNARRISNAASGLQRRRAVGPGPPVAALAAALTVTPVPRPPHNDNRKHADKAPARTTYCIALPVHTVSGSASRPNATGVTDEMLHPSARHQSWSAVKTYAPPTAGKHAHDLAPVPVWVGRAAGPAPKRRLQNDDVAGTAPVRDGATSDATRQHIHPLMGELDNGTRTALSQSCRTMMAAVPDHRRQSSSSLITPTGRC